MESQHWGSRMLLQCCDRWGRIGCASILIVVFAWAPGHALASENAHSDPIAQVALSLAIILIAAKLGGDLAFRIGQPAVLGELFAGVLLGNLGLLGISALEDMK